MKRPYFSITIPVYNRETFIRDCIKSCLNQSFSDFEVIVVDDGSLDNTLPILHQFNDPRLKIIRHLENRGINAARSSATANAIGEWIIGLDSDWELFPASLERLFDLTRSLEINIIGVRARQIFDTGFISPPSIPKEPLDYVGRIKYVENVGGYDVLGCYRREMYDQLVTYPERLGGDAGFFLDVLNMHQLGLMLYIDDVLCKQYSDAPNSVTRGNIQTRVSNLKRFAADTLWMYQETIRLHGDALKKFGPVQYINIYRSMALQHFYLGERRNGFRTMWNYLHKKPLDCLAWTTLCFGLLGPRCVIYGNAIRHSIRSTYWNVQNRTVKIYKALLAHLNRR